jgi:ABC-type glycerol-3-phosphate transport system substrate-binding protein
VEALNSPEVNVADDYFGGEKAFGVFLETMKTAHPFPYVAQWSDIDTYFTDAMSAIGLGAKDVKTALDDAAKQTEDILKQ